MKTLIIIHTSKKGVTNSKLKLSWKLLIMGWNIYRRRVVISCWFRGYEYVYFLINEKKILHVFDIPEKSEHDHIWTVSRVVCDVIRVTYLLYIHPHILNKIISLSEKQGENVFRAKE